MILKSIFRILIALLIATSLCFISGWFYWQLASDPKIENAFLIGLLVLGMIFPIYIFFRGKENPEDSRKDLVRLLEIAQPIIVISEIAVVVFITFWWVFPKEEDLFYVVSVFLIMSYAYVFNELPTKGLDIIKSNTFKTKQLPALVIATCGYLFGLLK